RRGPWKLLVHRRKGRDRVELFNLEEDPNEKNDLSEMHPDRLGPLLKALAEQEARDNDALPNDPKPEGG
ncbi:MAG: hypothetical protein R3236_07240, partial [Phycisphaeraceae bacterium]|nr:hypothetical protein [Phycisphaeraceae bacterium]